MGGPAHIGSLRLRCQQVGDLREREKLQVIGMVGTRKSAPKF